MKQLKKHVQQIYISQLNIRNTAGAYNWSAVQKLVYLLVFGLLTKKAVSDVEVYVSKVIPEEMSCISRTGRDYFYLKSAGGVLGFKCLPTEFYVALASPTNIYTGH